MANNRSSRGGSRGPKRRPTSNKNFRPTARKVAKANHWTPMRGGIRF